MPFKNRFGGGPFFSSVQGEGGGRDTFTRVFGEYVARVFVDNNDEKLSLFFVSVLASLRRSFPFRCGNCPKKYCRPRVQKLNENVEHKRNDGFVIVLTAR